VSASVATFVFEVINFVFLAAALGWVFTKPMRKLLDTELKARADARRTLAEREAEVERVRGELSKRLASMDEEIAQARERARTDAKTEAVRIVDAARAQANEERARVLRETEEQRRSEVEALAAELGRAAEKLVLDLFALGAGAEADLAFARAAGSKLSKLVAKGNGVLIVEYAHAPSEEVRVALKSSLGSALDHAEVRIVPELVAGVRVLSDAGLVDASALGLARYAESVLRSAGVSGNG
jgi:F0F1-type ATP synthase membrane subunit b/b'